jgi:hypothetical protein
MRKSGLWVVSVGALSSFLFGCGGSGGGSLSETPVPIPPVTSEQPAGTALSSGVSATALAVGPDGVLYFVDSINGGTVRRFANGQVNRVAGRGGFQSSNRGDTFSFGSTPSGLAMSPKGDLVASGVRLWRFTPRLTQ